MKANPFKKLDPDDAIRNPASIPLIMKRAMANIMISFKTGKRGGNKDKTRDPGDEYERFVSAFNIITTQFTRKGLILGRTGSISLTGVGRVQENELKKKDRGARRARILKEQKADPKKRSLMRSVKPLSVNNKLIYLDRIIARLQEKL
jgi:hypothetical protein